jgi:hypothetical protein
MTDRNEAGKTREATRPGGVRAGVLRRRQWLVLGLCAVLAVTGIVVWLSRSGDAQPGGTQPISVHSVPAGPGGGSAGGSVAVGPVPSPVTTHLHRRVATALIKWNKGRGGTALAAVSNQLGEATQSAGVRLFADMKQACSELATAVTAARIGPPIPDAAMQSRYIGALSKLRQAARSCIAGISTHDSEEPTVPQVDSRLLSKALEEFRAGTKELYRATWQVEALGSRHQR